MAKRRKTKRTKAVKSDRMELTPEREARNDFRSVGMARRVVPVIETLFNKGLLTEPEHKALAYYRDQASLAERSPVKSGIDFSIGVATGNGPGVAILSAAIETGRLERDMGQLWPLARAVAVDDMTLGEWCVAQSGGREKRSGGKVVAIVPRNPRAIELARLELRMAARRMAHFNA